MIPSGAKVFLASHPVDFRKGPDGLVGLVRDAGAEIVQEPADQPWGQRDFAVRDPSGNLVRVEQA